MAISTRIASIPAGAGVQGGNEHEVGRERRGIQCSGDRNDSILEWLPKHFQRSTIELGQFIQKQNAIVSHADFARCWNAPTANKSRFTDRVMGTAKRTLGHQRLTRPKPTKRAIDSSRLDGFNSRQRG